MAIFKRNISITYILVGGYLESFVCARLNSSTAQPLRQSLNHKKTSEFSIQVALDSLVHCNTKIRFYLFIPTSHPFSDDLPLYLQQRMDQYFFPCIDVGWCDFRSPKFVFLASVQMYSSRCAAYLKPGPYLTQIIF